MDEREQIALEIVDGNEEKCKLLLQLIDMSVSAAHTNTFEGIKMVAAEQECPHCHEGDCWLNIPDSVHPCEGPCNYYAENMLNPCISYRDTI